MRQHFGSFAPTAAGKRRTVGTARALLALGTVLAIAAGGLAQSSGHEDRGRLTADSTTEEAVLAADDGTLAAEEITALEAEPGIVTEEAVVVFEGHVQDITVGVNTETNTTPVAMDQAVIGTLNDMELDAQKYPSPDGSLEEAINAAQETAADSVEYDTVTVELQDGAEVPADMEVVEQQSDAPDQPLYLASDADCGNTWWPNYVIGHSGASSVAGMRYGTVRFAWTTNSRMTNLHCYDDVTFEPDFKTYNYDDRHYYRKTIEAWSTSMPDGYKDTQFLDGDNEYIFTIGTSRAGKLDPDKEYRTYFRTENGNTSSDDGAIYLQRGNRTPSYCDSTWCIFAQETKKYVAAWDLPIPGLLTESK